MITKKTVTIDVAFIGTGRIVRRQNVFMGGVVDPAIKTLGFNVLPEGLDDDGAWYPSHGSESLAGALQINIWGSSDDYRELARYFLGIAELDASADPDFHEHHDLTTADGRTLVHLIVRKPRLDPKAAV